MDASTNHIAQLTDTSLQIWDTDRLVIWSPMTDGTDLDVLLASMGYRLDGPWADRADGCRTAWVQRTSAATTPLPTLYR